MSCEIEKGRVLYRQYHGLLPPTATRLCSMRSQNLRGADLIVVKQAIRSLRRCRVFARLVNWILRLTRKPLHYPYQSPFQPRIPLTQHLQILLPPSLRRRPRRQSSSPSPYPFFTICHSLSVLATRITA